VNGGNVLAALRRIQGAFSLIIMSERELIAVRDPFGWRPLSLGNSMTLISWHLNVCI